MHLGVVAQGLEMAYPLHRRGNGLFVENVPVGEGGLHPEPLGDDPGQNLRLHLSHDLGVDLPVPLVPYDVQ